MEPKTRTERIVYAYAHDYRDMNMSESVLSDMLEGFVETLDCDHACTSNCRREGCKCDCGEYHL